MTNWNISGEYMENCNCEAVCPCLLLSPPTEGECKALVAWHIDEGQSGDIDISGLNVALAIHSPGYMPDGNWRVALYLDARASEEQVAALTPIFAGQAGGHFEVLGSFIGEVAGVKQVSMDFTLDGNLRGLTMADIAEMNVEALAGGDGGNVTLTNHPLAVVPGVPATVAKSTSELNLKDQGFEFAIPTGRGGVFSKFTYSNAA